MSKTKLTNFLVTLSHSLKMIPTARPAVAHLNFFLCYFRIYFNNGEFSLKVLIHQFTRKKWG